MCYILCMYLVIQSRLDGLMSYEGRVQQIVARVTEELNRLDSTKLLNEKLQSLNHLWTDTARKLGN